MTVEGVTWALFVVPLVGSAIGAGLATSAVFAWDSNAVRAWRRRHRRAVVPAAAPGRRRAT